MAHWVSCSRGPVANIRITVAQGSAVAPNPDRIARHEAPGARIEIAGAVVVNAGFHIITPASKERGIGDLGRGDDRTPAIQKRRHAVIIVAVLFDDGPGVVGDLADTAQIIGVIEAPLAAAIHGEQFINAVAPDISGHGRVGAVLLLNLLPAGVIVAVRGGGSGLFKAAVKAVIFGNFKELSGYKSGVI